MMGKCISCGGDIVPGLAFEAQPVSNCYHLEGVEPRRFPMSLVQCEDCALVQLAEPFHYADVSPPHSWIKYVEPEQHLDDLCDKLMGFLGQRDAPLCLATSYKDNSVLERLNKRGIENTRTLHIRDDLQAQFEFPNIESVAGLLTVVRANEIVSKIGKADLIVARHVLEHSENVTEFLKALRCLLKDDGIIVFEVPDCAANLARCDLAMIWEEHATYFTEFTFNRIFSRHGLKVLQYESYPLSFENCLVCFATPSDEETSATPDDELAAESSLFKHYCGSIREKKQNIRAYLKQAIAEGERFAIYGAGHLACTFINLYEVQDFISCIVDDTPEKQGLYLPGTGRKISDKQALFDTGVTKCLLALSVEIEGKVIRRNEQFASSGGEFYSVFAASPITFESLLGG